jgi:hypothetical protein
MHDPFLLALLRIHHERGPALPQAAVSSYGNQMIRRRIQVTTISATSTTAKIVSNTIATRSQ